MYFCDNSITMKYLISTLITFLLISCDSSNKKDSITYFGGEIINPKSNFILLLKDEKVLDTLFLDKKNRFLSKYKGIKEGLYTFKHGIEFQYIYIEPTDSILVRLNSWDFDESIVYSGKGSSKNEFLLNLFLQNEKEEKSMYKYFNAKETVFISKIDSLTKLRTANFNEFLKNEKNISKGFKNLTNIAINYPLYRLKEVYPYLYKKAHYLDKFPPLSKNYYTYRNGLDLNIENLVSFYPYQNYIISFLYNTSYQQIEQENTSKSNLTSNILKNITKYIENENFKNTLLKRVVVNDFLKGDATCTINEETLKIFLKNCTNKEYIKQVTNLVNDSKAIQNNELLPNFEIESSETTLSNINDVIKNQNTVIYFWSTEFTSTEYLVKRIEYLRRKFPNILFIGINMKTTFKEIKSEYNLKKLNINNQYKLTTESVAHNYLTSNYPRIIIVNNKGIVKNGFTYLDSNKLESELNKLEIN